MKLFNKPSFCYRPLNMKALDNFYLKLASIEEAKNITINGRMAQDTAVDNPWKREYLEEDIEYMAKAASEVFEKSDLCNIRFYVPTFIRYDERSIKMGIKLDNEASGLIFEDTIEDIEGVMISENVAYIQAERPLDIIMDISYMDSVDKYLFQAGEISRNLFENGSVAKIVENIKTKIGFEKYDQSDGKFIVMQFHIARDKDLSNSNDMSGFDGTHQLLPILMIYDENKNTYTLETHPNEEYTYFGRKKEFMQDLHKVDLLCHTFPRIYTTYQKQKAESKRRDPNSKN